MAVRLSAAPTGAEAPRRRWLSAIAKALVGIALFLVAAIGGIGLLLDTDLGHRLILDRIAAIAPESGLRIRIGRIEGSIWGRTGLRDVRLYDPEGLFAEAPRMELEWQPLAWLANRLLIREIASDLAIVHRLPRLDDDDDFDLSLPDFDLHIGRLDIAQLRLAEAVGGTSRTARVSGEVEFRRRRLLLDLDATTRGGGDRLELLVDSEPDRDRFDLDLKLDSPAGGLFAHLFGASERVRVEVSGDGEWRRWAGSARFGVGGRSAGELRLGAASGLYSAEGWLAPSPLLPASLAALAGARVNVSAEGRFDDRLLEGRLAARSAQMRLACTGSADFERRIYSDVRLAFELLRPHRLIGDLAAGTRLTALLGGSFDEATLSYRLSAPRVQFGTVAVEILQASGSGRWSHGRLAVPLTATAGRIAWPAGTLLDGVRLSGSLLLAGDRLSGRNLILASRRLRTRFGLDADLADGRYAMAGTAAGEGIKIEGLGSLDLAGEWRASSDGERASFGGRARGTARRLDNAALARASGGPLRIETTIVGDGGEVRFPNLSLVSPALRLTGNAMWHSDGGLIFGGRGRQAILGPLGFRYRDERLSLRLARPAPDLGLADVLVDVIPARDGIGYRARGRSPLGPFDARGLVLPASDTIRIAALSLAGASGSGSLRAVGDGLAGRLDLAGDLAGPLELGFSDGRQTVVARLVASDAVIGAVPLGSGRIDAQVAIAGGDSLSGRVRFDGAADRLWEMTRLAGMRLSGPVQVEANLGGTLAAPLVHGRLRLAGGRLAGSGTAVDRVQADGTFDLRRLTLASFSGRSGDGRVEGSGTIAFDGPLDLRLEGDRIAVARGALQSEWRGRLRMAGTVSAPVLIGEAELIRGTYRILGRAIRLSRGTMRFDGSTDPVLDIVTAPPAGFGPGIRITGRASRPEIGVAVPSPAAPEPPPAPQSEGALLPGGAGRRATRATE